MKEISQQLEISTIELTKFRSNTNEGSFLSINEELQLVTSFIQDLHHFSAQQRIIAKTLDTSINHPSSKTTRKYMKDNNIAKKTDTVQFFKTLEIQNLVPT